MPARRFRSARSPGNRLSAIAISGSPCLHFLARLLTHPRGEAG
jgi:hypothetical protein